jgi:hypothetical protein
MWKISGTAPGFNTDIYYFVERNATLIINVKPHC